jgi:hypothetical protein
MAFDSFCALVNEGVVKMFGRGAFLSLLFLFSATAEESIRVQLPADVPINESAGRGGFLVVTLRQENGEELPCVVDSGASGTTLDFSCEPKLGKRLGSGTVQIWGKHEKINLYDAPRLYLGGVPLVITGGGIMTSDCKDLGADNGRQIMGIIGMDVLENYCVQLDFAAGKMRFLDDEHADKEKWGKAFPIVPLSDKDLRPAVSQSLFGQQGPHSLIDSGCTYDSWFTPSHFQQWTNQAASPAKGDARFPDGIFGGEKYPFVDVIQQKVGSDGIGLRFLARHLVTLDFPKHTLYLQRQSIGPLADPSLKTTRMAALDSLIKTVMLEDVVEARLELVKIERSNTTTLEKIVAQKLEATLEDKPKPIPADVPLDIPSLPLGDARAEQAEVGWLKPSANRIPPNDQIESPLLDSGKIYATGLFAHSPSRYVYDLGGKWKSLRGEAGLHTAFQSQAFGIVFVIKADGREMFRSDVIRDATHAHYDVDVSGVKTLELLVEKATDGNGCNWGLWLDPTLFR